jgi:putative methyltransferase (TIGR04325 family)
MKSFLKSLVPPLIFILFRFLFHKNYFYGNFASWKEAQQNSSGYDKKNILNKVLISSLSVMNGIKKFERDSVVFDQIQYSWPISTAIMLAAAANSGELNILDYGGSLGSCYFQNKKLLHYLKSVKWNIIEQPHFVEMGRKEIADRRISFYSDIKECLSENRPSIILFSSVIQYLDNPYEILDGISKINAQFLVFDRTPFHSGGADRIMVQHVSPSIYNASYPIRILSKSSFLNFLLKDWDLIAEGTSHEGEVILNNNFYFIFSYLILRKKDK